MVNPKFMQNYLECINKEFKGMLAGPPAVWPGGVEMDHYKGLASALAVRVVPFMKETYEATEFVFGAIPVNNAIVPRMYFQCAVLNVGGKNVPGVGNFGAVVRAPVPETYVAPYADWKYRLLPLSAFTGEDVSASKVFKAKVGWNPLLEAVNNDKKALKALGKPWNSSTVGNYKVKMDSMRIPGFVQLAPYKGHTLMTAESTPGIGANVDKPLYDFKDLHEVFFTLAAHVIAHPMPGPDVGNLYLNQGNAALMDLMTKAVNVAAGPPAGATPAQGPPQG